MRIISQCVVVLGLVSIGAVAQAASPLTVEQAHQDIDKVLELVEATHPDLGFSADRNELKRASEQIKRRIDAPLSVQDLWLHVSKLNPLFRDAHIGIRYPVKEYKAYQADGGAVFPVRVYVDRDASLRVHETVPPGGPLKPHTKIHAINSMETTEIINALAPRMRGETLSLQRFVMSHNFPAYFWTLHGGASAFSVEISGTSAGYKTVPLDAPADGTDVKPDGGFQYDILNGDTGYIRARSFHIALKADFRAFLGGAFEAFDKAGIERLIIDVRDNTGGAHDVSDLLVGYLIDKPVAPASAVKARVTPEIKGLIPDAALGDVVTIPYPDRIAPHADRTPFKGKVFVMVSADTYSQAIVFAVTLKDNGLARVVGEPTGGNANQTGQVTMSTLGHSELMVAAPLYIIYRPNGDRSAGPLQPDIPLAHNKQDPNAMVDALLTRLTGAR